MPTVHMRRRLLAANTTQSALAVTSGMHTVESVGDLITANESIVNQMMVTLGQGHQTAEKRRGIEITALGTGADNATMTFAVFQMKRGQVTSGGRLKQALDFELTLLYTVVCTLSTATGATDGELVSSSERIADTMVVTQSAAAQAIETAYGAAAGAAYSPAAGNAPARFFLPDVGGGDVLIETIVGTATSANLVVEAQT